MGWRMPKQPIARAVFGLDAIVVAHKVGLLVADPPFAMDALGPVRLGSPVAHAAPDEEAGRMIRQFGNRLDPFRWSKEARGARQVPGPFKFRAPLKGRDAPYCPFRQAAFDRSEPEDFVL